MLFDNNYELLHDRIDIKAVSPITEKEYQVGGSTALLDAIGGTIHKIGNARWHTADDYRAEKVMFVIITDGRKTATAKYSADKVKAQIELQKAKYGWGLSSLAQISTLCRQLRASASHPTALRNYHADSGAWSSTSA